MSIVERLFPASELEALRMSMRNFSAGHGQTEQSQPINHHARTLHALRSTSSHGCGPRSRGVELARRKIKTPHSRREQPPTFILLTHGSGKDRSSRVVYALDRARTDACQDLSGADGRAIPPSLQALGGPPRKRAAAQADTATKLHCREEVKFARPLPAVDQETGQRLLEMPLITMHERALLTSLLPCPTSWVNDEDRSRHSFKGSFLCQDGVSSEMHDTPAEPDLFEYLNIEEAGEGNSDQGKGPCIPRFGGGDDSTSLSSAVSDEHEDVWIGYPWYAAA